MYDVKEWLDTEMLYMEHHNFPHTFMIERQDGEITMFYKIWSSDKEWLKANLKAIQNLSLQGRPLSGPSAQRNRYINRQRPFSRCTKGPTAAYIEDWP
ncbi:Hypp6186 [Branchiostoma lanceolatum]|uniref:Hypp6186 protein n=1 Tax=Branchiostoma lanceolatum TaxID=7740 RepID=A0A8J9VIA2_BRALA|nr:Hypp6186 [Branchiostoma lanceolatum]